MVLERGSSLDKLIRLTHLNKCRCGSTKISITDIQTRAIIKCCECGREIKRRTLKKAEQAWNKNNPNHCDKFDRIAFADDFCSYGDKE